MDGSGDSFRDLLLRHRGRTGLTQGQLAERVGVHRRSVQEWEIGVTYPTAARLEALVRVLLEADGLTAGQEETEARALWAAVQRDAAHAHASFDASWFARLQAERAASHAPEPASGGGPRPSSPLSLGQARPDEGERNEDWGEAPDTVRFVGRTQELGALRSWLLDERSRLVVVLGMGGIGKTSLAAKVAQDTAPRFDRVYWRSLRDAPPVGDWLASAIGFLSDQQLVPPTAESERLTSLLELLRQRRCLLVLDNSEALFEPGQQEGRYRSGLAGYGRLFRAVGEASHRSCLMVTSRERPPELSMLNGEALRTLELAGLGVDEARVLLAPKQLRGTSQQWAELNARFGGNGLALKLVGETVRAVFGGDIGAFLEEAAGGVFGGIRRLLFEQVERSSALEQQVLRVLAVEREPVTIVALLAALGPRVGRGAVVEAMEALRRRSLADRAETPGAAAFTLQSVVLEYVTDRLVEDVSSEIARGEPVLLVNQPLIKAQAKDYVRETQERLIGTPILKRLEAHHDQRGTERRLVALLDGLRARPPAEQGYAPGNLVNLLRLLQGHLRDLDLSQLLLRQAYLAQVDAQGASLVDAHIAETVLAEAFDFPVSIALSEDGALLAVGTSTGQVCLWRVADRTPLLTVQGPSTVRGVALSGDGQLLAGGGADGVVRLWETSTGRQVATLQGDTGGVWSVALSADGRLLACSGEDGPVQLWEATTGRPVATLHGNTGPVSGVALSADGRLLASSSGDGTVRLWEASTGRPPMIMQGHTGTVYDVALSTDGQLLASGGSDGTVRLWEASTGRPLATLHGHTGAVWGVALSAGGRLLTSSGQDGTVRLWEASTGRPVSAVQGHTGTVRSVAMSADGQLLVSGGGDGTVRLWEASTGRPQATLQGLTGGVWSVALSTGQLLASGGTDGRVRLWDASTGKPVATLHGHTGTVRSVALSGDGMLLASGGGDGTVRLWETTTGRPLATLQGHTGTVYAVALSSDGRLLASSSGGGTVRLWETSTGRPLATLQGHTGPVYGVALSADGQLLASGGFDGTVRLWETGTGQPLATLQGHIGTVWGVALSGDGRLLASGGGDRAVRLWEASTGRAVASLEGNTGLISGVALSADGRLLATSGADGTVRLWETGTGRPPTTTQGHTGVARGVALSADGQLLASGGYDATVRLWEASTGSLLRTLRAERRYERLDITGLSGITDAQRAVLLALGAVEQRGPLDEPAARDIQR
jgi:WD40 repeat protein/transcriptional regulator with XRE-family HTH domain